MNVAIRSETTADLAAIRQVHRKAFGQDGEARLVDALRDGQYVRISLVAVKGGQIVGHILFSDLPIITADRTVPALALAPLAVMPKHQGRGLGTQLVRQGLDLCRDEGHSIVVVLGHPKFYRHFGFSSELAMPLNSPFSGEAWMAIELADGALRGITGRVQYPVPFTLL
jgi:putative acetyltransferase